jgi:glutaredoxin
MSGPTTEHLDALKADAASAPVVVFASRVTDVREILDRLDAVGLEHRVVTLAMRDPSQRERFHVLEEWTGSRVLPQVFLDGHYIGGPKEFLAHPRLQGPTPAAGAWLGYAGLLPFALGLAGLIDQQDRVIDHQAQQNDETDHGQQIHRLEGQQIGDPQ